VYENVAPDSFELVWTGNLERPNAYMHQFLGDADGDGFGEWVSGSHDFSHGGFFFKLFEATGDNQYSPIYIDSLPGNPWRTGGVDDGDVDNDRINEFIFSSNFNVGLYKYFPNEGWARVWRLDSLEGTVFPYLVDCDGDGYYEPAMTSSHSPSYTRIYNLITTDLKDSNIKQVNDFIDIYPNPTNSNIIVSFSETSDFGKIYIYDILGRIIFQGPIPVYKNSIEWKLRDIKGKEVQSGIYFIRLVSDNHAVTKKMVIIR
jgi:hypothetical protein